MSAGEKHRLSACFSAKGALNNGILCLTKTSVQLLGQYAHEWLGCDLRMVAWHDHNFDAPRTTGPQPR